MQTLVQGVLTVSLGAQINAVSSNIAVAGQNTAAGCRL